MIPYAIFVSEGTTDCCLLGSTEGARGWVLVGAEASSVLINLWQII